MNLTIALPKIKGKRIIISIYPLSWLIGFKFVWSYYTEKFNIRFLIFEIQTVKLDKNEIQSDNILIQQ